MVVEQVNIGYAAKVYHGLMRTVDMVNQFCTIFSDTSWLIDKLTKMMVILSANELSCNRFTLKSPASMKGFPSRDSS